MRYPIARVRPLEDDEVDRAEVEVQQCTELTVTNRSRAYPERLFKGFGSSVCGFEGIVLQMARWLSWLERRPVTAEVVGSNPIRVALLK